MGPGTPTASISGGLTGGLSLNSQGLITTTANQSLTLGALGTGNVVLAPGGTTALTAQGANVSVAGTLGVGGALTAGSGITVSSGNVNLTGVTPSYQIAGVSVLSATTLGAGVLSSSLTGVGTITTGTWQAAAVGTGYGGTGQNFSATATGSLPYFVSSGTMGALGVGSAGQILTVSGGAPAWRNAGGTVNFWQLNNGALSPFNTTNDLLLGATSTSSARFAFTNAVGPGTPTASISGDNRRKSP